MAHLSHIGYTGFILLRLFYRQVVAERKIGNTMLTSGHLLGFGTADFEPEYLKVRPTST